MENKIYDQPIAFDVDMPVKGVKRFTVYARSDEEAVKKVETRAFEPFDSEWFEELDCEKPYVIDADESNVHPRPILSSIITSKQI